MKILVMLFIILCSPVYAGKTNWWCFIGIDSSSEIGSQVVEECEREKLVCEASISKLNGNPKCFGLSEAAVFTLTHKDGRVDTLAFPEFKACVFIANVMRETSPDVIIGKCSTMR